jgi:hypothetical protein
VKIEMRKFLTVPPELLVLKSGPTSCLWVNIELAIWCMYGTASLPIAVIAVEILISWAYPICSGYQSAVDVKLPKVTLGDICHVVYYRQGWILVHTQAETNSAGTRRRSMLPRSYLRPNKV